MMVEQKTPVAVRTAPQALVAERVMHLWAALQFLTRLPAPEIRWQDDTLARALFWFPAIGLALGAAAGAFDLLLAAHLQRTVAAALTVAALILITGGLHEDALADCADAFGSHHSVERTLAILRDSRIGAYGGMALVVSILLRTLLVADLPLEHSIALLAAAGMLGRTAILPLTLLPPATPALGQGRHIARRTPRSIIAGGLGFGVIASVLLLGMHALPAVGVACAVTAGSAIFYRKRLGGITGDCFGATVQLVETAVLLTGVWTR